MEVFKVSLGNLEEPKGFGSPTGSGTGLKGVLTPEKAIGQYRKTGQKHLEKHTMAHRETQ